jgi:oxaloacetate decarboxylase alpha subunit
VCIRYLKENPWERIRLMRQRVTRTPLSSFTRSKNLVSFDLVPDDIVALWVERLVANGFREVGSLCAQHVRSLGSASLLSNLMEVKD